MSRCAIAVWASRTWAFDSANFLPPWRPCARNADAHEFLTARHQTALTPLYVKTLVQAAWMIPWRARKSVMTRW